MQRQSLTTSQQHTDAQPVSKQRLFWKNSLPQFYCWAWCYIARNISLVNSGQLSSLCPLPTTCPPLVYSLGWQRKKQRKPSASAAQQYLKRDCIINIVLITNPKHTTLPAAVKKMNSLPTRPSREPYKLPKALEPEFNSIYLQELNSMAPTTL